jgi:hypothetical protein
LAGRLKEPFTTYTLTAELKVVEVVCEKQTFPLLKSLNVHEGLNVAVLDVVVELVVVYEKAMVGYTAVDSSETITALSKVTTMSNVCPCPRPTAGRMVISVFVGGAWVGVAVGGVGRVVGDAVGAGVTSL